jgi:hypothetical protein
LNEEVVLNHSLSDAQLFDTPIYDKYYDSDDDLYKKKVVFSSSKNSDQLEDMLNLIEVAPNSDEDQAVDMNSESREHLETKNYECQDSKDFYDQPIFYGYLSDDDEHNFFMASLEPLSIVPVYDDCGSDSWEGNGGEKKELQKQLIMPLSPNDDQQIAEISKSSFVIPETGPAEEIKQNMISNENNLQQPPVLQKNNIGSSRSSVQLRFFSFSGIQNEDLTPSQSFLLDHQEVVHEFHDPCGTLHGVKLGSLFLSFWLHKGIFLQL